MLQGLQSRAYGAYGAYDYLPVPTGTYSNSDSYSDSYCRLPLGKQVATVVKYGPSARIPEGNPSLYSTLSYRAD